MRQASWSLTTLIERMSSNVHPPFFHVLLHYWVWVFGKSEVAVRLFPAVFGIAAIPVMYWSARTVYGRRVGLIAAFTLALSPFFIWYSQEARMYTMMLLFATGSIGALWKSLEENRWYWWGLYGLCSAAGAMTQYFFVLLTGMQAVFVLFYVVIARTRSLRKDGTSALSWTRPWGIFRDVPELYGWLAAMVMVALPLSWWLPKFLSQKGTADLATQPLNYGWDAPTLGIHFNELIAVPVQVLTGFHSQLVSRDLAAVWPLLITLVFLSVGFARPVSRRTIYLLISGVGSVTVLAALGQWQPVLDSRYFTAFLAPVVILFARLLAQLKPRTYRIVATLLLVMCAIGWADQSFNRDSIVKWDNREAMEIVTRGWQPGDAVLLVPYFVNSVAEYYLPPRVYSATKGLPAFDPKGRLRSDPVLLGEDIRKRVHSANRVWLISSWQDTPQITMDRENAIESLIAQGYTLTNEWQLHRIGVSLFVGETHNSFFLPAASASSTQGVTP
ncbi:MAG: hypothetical protein HGB10_06580 [Coriobacteriia bacterium]|nr:hypothetical protein [Coriobacteriia bacterium]